jgi:hypothetical protein
MICCRGFYTGARASSRDHFPPRSVRAKVARHISTCSDRSESSTKVATWRIWGRAVSTPTCMSLTSCSGRAYQPPYQDRPVLFSSMDESVSGAARQGGTGQMTKVLRHYMHSYTYLTSECYTSPVVKQSSFLPSSDLFSVYRILLLGCASEQCKNTRGRAIGMMTATSDDSSCIITCLKLTNSSLGWAQVALRCWRSSSSVRSDAIKGRLIGDELKGAATVVGSMEQRNVRAASRSRSRSSRYTIKLSYGVDARHRRENYVFKDKTHMVV